MLECTITGISQEMDFERNETVTYLGLRLTNGVLLRAAIDEAAAAAIVGMQVEAKGAPKPAARPGPVPPPSQRQAPAQEEDDVLTPPDDDEFSTTTDEGGTTTHVFGGDSNGAAIHEPEPEPEPPPPQPPPGPPKQTPNSQTKPRVQKQQGRVTPRSKTVPAGEGGYPITPGSNIDPAALTSGRDQDEDGVGSV
jgi:hypothetical protein